MAQAPKNPLIKGLIGLLILIVGLVGGSATGMKAVQQMKSASWPTAEGTVIGGLVGESSGRRGRTNYTPEVSFRYSVGGVEYTSSRVAVVTDSHSSREAANRVVSKYAPGSNVTVKYDPANPGFGVLETAAGFDTFAQPGMMAMLVIIGLVMFVSALKAMKAPAPAPAA
ncbi:MAG: DUF3592 domain-containing protein [Planctomycetes bacterium]|nr:DUF3592 domain-containing protein [Planctomycetota bacterium]